MSQGFTRDNTDHGGLGGLADDDHTQYLNTTRHDAHDHTTAAASIALTELANGVAYTTFSPSWTATTTNPTIGNGTIVGNYSRFGQLVWFDITITMGSTTTFGSGLWQLSLPVTRTNTDVILCNAMARDNSPAKEYAAVGRLGTSIVATLAVGGTSGSANRIQSNVPFTWTQNDSLWVSGVYHL